MNYKEKKDLFDKHIRNEFPNGSETDELDDIIAEIAKLDSYYAGLATSAIGGSKVKKESLDDLYNLKDKMKKIDTTKEDYDNIANCENYIESLIKIVMFIINNQKE